MQIVLFIIVFISEPFDYNEKSANFRVLVVLVEFVRKFGVSLLLGSILIMIPRLQKLDPMIVHLIHDSVFFI